MVLPFWIGDLAGVIVLAPLFTGVLNKLFPTSYVKLGVFYTENLGSLHILASKISINLVLITLSMLTAYVLDSHESAFAIFFLAVTHMWIACTESPAFNIISLAVSSLLIVLLVHILGLMDHVMVYQFAINVIAANALFGMAVPQLMADNKALKNQVYTDTLTQVSSRHYMMKQAEREITKSHQSNTVLTLVVFDLDNFKQINDLYGHMAGDDALQQVCQVSKNTLRSNDLIARFGGDEFVLLLPGLDEPAALQIVNRIKNAISTIKIGDTHMSSSFGLAELKHDEVFNDLFKRADKALYHSKDQGGNKIIAAAEPA
ncbi:GGDEF domain-containing protein [Marinicella rhabdoformis]|uniref:GGDEF domain-containing protein n=1 Tax=Marinicella rhabdoformis TaxID=2580566 RepID=UPI001C555BFC|nr:GGDEF domain-containing protein [Marinicella rhabdoformis]